MASDNKVEIEIAAQATGLPEIAKVESGLKNIGQTGKDAGDKAAAGIDKIGNSFSSLRLYTALFHGYGDSLLDYNFKRTVFSIGLSLVDF